MIEYFKIEPPIPMRPDDSGEELLRLVTRRLRNTRGVVLSEGLHIVTPQTDTSRTHTVHVFSPEEARALGKNPGEGTYTIEPNTTQFQRVPASFRTRTLPLEASRTWQIMSPEIGKATIAVHGVVRHVPDSAPQPVATRGRRSTHGHRRGRRG